MEGLRLRVGILAREESCARKKAFRTTFIAALKLYALKVTGGCYPTVSPF